MATIVITPTEFTVGNDVIINGIIDDESVSKIDVNGSVIDLTGSEFSLNLGQLTAQSYALPITILDGDSAGETTEINFTVSAETPGGETGGSTEPTTPETPETPETPASSVITDDGKYTGVTEHGAALEGQEFYNKIMEDFDSNKFIPDYIPNKKMPEVDSIKTTLGGDPLYVPIESLEQRFPLRRNLEDSHHQLFGERYHPDMVDKGETPIQEVSRFTASSLGTGGFTF